MSNVAITNLRIAPIHGARVPTKLKAYAITSFLINDANRTAVTASSPYGAGGAHFKEWNLEVDSSDYYVPTVTPILPSTTDSPDNPNDARWGLFVFDADNRLMFEVAGLGSFRLDASDVSQSAEDIVSYTRDGLPTLSDRNVHITGDLQVDGGINADGAVHGSNIGSMAAQSSSAIAVTGGALSGVTLTNPTIISPTNIGSATGSGGLANTVDTVLAADTDANGSGQVKLQTRGLDRLIVQNDGKIDLAQGFSTATLAAMFGNVIDPIRDFGAAADGVTLDDTALAAAFAAVPSAGGIVFFQPGRTFKVSQQFLPKSRTLISGYGATIDAEAAGVAVVDTFLFVGSNVLGQERQDIIVEGLKMVNNASRYEIDIYGDTYTYAPHHIKIIDVITEGSTDLAGAFFINVGHHIWFIRCRNVGGAEHIGATCPQTDQTSLHHVWVKECDSAETTRYGIHFVYGKHLWVVDCVVDGSLMTTADKSGIVIDRSQWFKVRGNTVENCPTVNIFVTGSRLGTISENIVTGAGSGMFVAYNFEYGADPDIKECYRVNVEDNIIDTFGTGQNGLLINGLRYGSIVGNTIGDGADSPADVGLLVFPDQVRGDSEPMSSRALTIDGNTVGGILQTASSEPPRMGKNTFGQLIGSPLVADLEGSGSPEGVVTASVGSTYRRTNGGASTTFYVKESGVSNTGWIAK